MSDDWYRCTAWTQANASRFFEKLRRARRKEQYLRIQAATLATTDPEVALDLLEQYFELDDDFDHAQAHVDRATALLTLGRLDEALDSYEAALAREAEFGNLQTQAWLDLPFLIAIREVSDRYDRALELLDAPRLEGLMFPVDRFRWHAARALIAAAHSQGGLAEEHALNALDAATQTKSGFRYHPKVGLVSDEYSLLVERLRRLATGKARD